MGYSWEDDDDDGDRDSDDWGDGGNGGGLLGDSLGDVPVQDKIEDNTMPEIEDVIEDDNGGLSLPKMEEDSVIFWTVWSDQTL